jgi:hypothetical protein
MFSCPTPGFGVAATALSKPPHDSKTKANSRRICCPAALSRIVFEIRKGAVLIAASILAPLERNRFPLHDRPIQPHADLIRVNTVYTALRDS